MMTTRSNKVRKLAKFAIPALVLPLAFFTTEVPAHASIISSCTSGQNECSVYESMGNGFCNADLYQTNSSGDEDFTGTYVRAEYEDYDTGYSCHFWINRNVNDSGWYEVSSTTDLASSSSDKIGAITDNYFNDGDDGYQAEVCFQFDWGSSLGAVHCSTYVTYG
jgi:hypothetical protein